MNWNKIHILVEKLVLENLSSSWITKVGNKLKLKLIKTEKIAIFKN